MVTFTLKKDAAKEYPDLCLGYKEITVLANIGPFPGGGDCLVVKADGKHTTINSNDLIADLEAYDIISS